MAETIEELLRRQFSDVAAGDTNVKEVVQTILRRGMVSALFAQVAGPDMAFRDAITFEVAVIWLHQSTAVWPHIG